MKVKNHLKSLEYTKENKLYLDLLTLLLFWVTLIFHIIAGKAPHTYDTDVLITPFHNINSLTDYIDNVVKFHIVDVQPVRDFFYFFLAKLELLLSTNLVYLFANFIFFSFIYLELKLFFSTLFTNNKMTYIASSVILLHPAITNVALSTTDLKHILSFLFILKYINTTLVFQKRRLLYLVLSLFSQPINVLTPFIALVITNKGINKKFFKQYFSDLIIIFTAIIVNLIYYKYIFPQSTGVTKFASEPITEKIYVIGKYGTQFFFPYHYSIFYNTYSPLNYLGLIILFTLVLICYKLFSSKKDFLLSFTPLACVCIILYTGGNTQKYLNPYILTPALGFSYFLVRLISKFHLIQIAILSSLYSISVMYSYERSLSVVHIKNSYSREYTCANLQSLLEKFAINGWRKDLLIYGKKWFATNCAYINGKNFFIVPFYQTQIIYVSNELNWEEKRKLLNSKLTSDIHKLYINIAIDIQLEENKIRIQDQLSHYLKLKSKSMYSLDKSIIQKDVIRFCEVHCSQDQLKQLLEDNRKIAIYSPQKKPSKKIDGFK